MHVFMTTFLLLRNSYTECQSPYVEFGLELGGATVLHRVCGIEVLQQGPGAEPQ